MPALGAAPKKLKLALNAGLANVQGYSGQQVVPAGSDKKSCRVGSVGGRNIDFALRFLTLLRQPFDNALLIFSVFRMRSEDPGPLCTTQPAAQMVCKGLPTHGARSSTHGLSHIASGAPAVLHPRLRTRRQRRNHVRVCHICGATGKANTVRNVRIRPGQRLPERELGRPIFHVAVLAR